MKSSHLIAAGTLALAASALSIPASAMDQSPDAPPDATASGAPSSQGHGALPSGMAAGTSVNHDTVMQNTATFLVQTAQDDAADMAAAQYAEANSRSPDVKQFASEVLASKSHSTDELRDVAAKLGINMPTYPTTEQLRALNTLHDETGAKFDAAYAQFMADEHTTALARFKRAAQSNALDPTVRRFAQNSLPSMQDRLQRANRLVASHATRSRTG
jgi:putative membrane protein